MLPLEFIVAGTPVTARSKNAVRLKEWRDKVRAAALAKWPPGEAPELGTLRIVVMYFHDAPAVRKDNDNIVKPIQDALNKLVYADDRQISDTSLRKTDLNGNFKVRGQSAILFEGFALDTEFLYVRIEAAPNHAELL
jgi:crossover junction endodeoxyribonuclease RusA